MPRRQHLALVLCCAAAGRAASVPEIVRNADHTLRSDWAAYEDYAYIERDETRKNGQTSSRTSQVLTIDGSSYYMQDSEIEKLRSEVVRRHDENPEARRRRLESYRNEREENGALLLEFPSAFTFDLLREETIDGYPAYVLAATPIHRTGPLTRAAKVLAGMHGTVWIAKDGFHVVRAEGNVTAPVPIYGMLARVLPGTRIEIEMTPVTPSTWLIGRFERALKISKFFWFRSTEETVSTYSDYRPNAAALEELLTER